MVAKSSAELKRIISFEQARLIVDPSSDSPFAKCGLDEGLCLPVGPGSIGLGEYLAKAELLG